MEQSAAPEEVSVVTLHYCPRCVLTSNQRSPLPIMFHLKVICHSSTAFAFFPDVQRSAERRRASVIG